MVIRRLKIKNFGKIRDKDMELSPGINVLYGENESGKTTTHTFIRSMFYGVRRLRGKASQNDTYTKYEPWENPAEYGGILWFTSKGKNYRLTRNFFLFFFQVFFSACRFCQISFSGHFQHLHGTSHIHGTVAGSLIACHVVLQFADEIFSGNAFQLRHGNRVIINCLTHISENRT